MNASVRQRPYVVITSISAPNTALRQFAEESAQHSHGFIVVGDTKSPSDFDLPGCEFYNVEAQSKTGLKFATVCPTRHYARKNIGYLLAIRAGATVIRDTDDDNLPRAGFWAPLERAQSVPQA